MNVLMPFWTADFILGTYILLDSVFKSFFKDLHPLLVLLPQQISVEVES